LYWLHNPKVTFPRVRELYMDRGSIYYLSDTLKYDERSNVILRIFFTLLKG
jgi:hypothetical protein